MRIRSLAIGVPMLLGPVGSAGKFRAVARLESATGALAVSLGAGLAGSPVLLALWVGLGSVKAPPGRAGRRAGAEAGRRGVARWCRPVALRVRVAR